MLCFGYQAVLEWILIFYWSHFNIMWKRKFWSFKAINMTPLLSKTRMSSMSRTAQSPVKTWFFIWHVKCFLALTYTDGQPDRVRSLSALADKLKVAQSLPCCMWLSKMYIFYLCCASYVYFCRIKCRVLLLLCLWCYSGPNLAAIPEFCPAPF